MNRLIAITILLSLSGCSTTPVGQSTRKVEGNQSIEKETKIHRLATTKRSPYDAFVYVNRIPPKAEEQETPSDLSGRILGRLANQEGRILLKLPAGMERDAYLGFKSFIDYEGNSMVGNCAACHTPESFKDSKKHVVAQGAEPMATPSLRNLGKGPDELRKIILAKIAASQQKRSGNGADIDKAYAVMNIDKKDVGQLVAFVSQLNDVSDTEFRKLILNAKLLDTSGDIE
jgi:mono/diheme cytochrome c family protein